MIPKSKTILIATKWCPKCFLVVKFNTFSNSDYCRNCGTEVVMIKEIPNEEYVSNMYHEHIASQSGNNSYLSVDLAREYLPPEFVMEKLL